MDSFGMINNMNNMIHEQNMLNNHLIEQQVLQNQLLINQQNQRQQFNDNGKKGSVISFEVNSKVAEKYNPHIDIFKPTTKTASMELGRIGGMTKDGILWDGIKVSDNRMSDKIDYNYLTSNNIFSNTLLGNKLLMDFNKEFPDIESSTLTAAEIIDMNKNNVDEYLINEKIKKGDYLNDKYMKFLNDTRFKYDTKNMPREEYVTLIKTNMQKYNIANCLDRALVVDDNLKKMGYENTCIVKMTGNDNYGGHVFNVIGLDKNADISKPVTWGKNAIVVDAWGGKVLKPNDAINFYRDFLEYNDNNQPSIFEEYKLQK